MMRSRWRRLFGTKGFIDLTRRLEHRYFYVHCPGERNQTFKDFE